MTAAALITFFQQGLLLYLLPLYFPARSLPSSSWETWGLYQVSAWIFAPLLSRLPARRMALRLVWATGLAVSAPVFAALIVLPDSVPAAAARAAGDLAGFDRGMTEASELLSQALGSSEVALRTWARRSVDRTELGTLAALNAYGHDWLRGVATQVYWESQRYGFSISDPQQVQ